MLFFYISLIESPDEKSKFEKLYYRYRNLMYHIAYNILRDKYLAEDAVHTAFIKIIDNLDKIDNITCHRTKAFVVIVVENVSKSMYTKRKKQNAAPLNELDFLVADKAQSLDSLLSKLSYEEIVSKIKQLSDADSRILMLRYVYDLSNRDIARLMDTSDPTIRKRLERARRRLAGLLIKSGDYYGK